VHSFSYDVLGRVTSDSVTTLAAGADGAIRRIEYTYDTAGRLFDAVAYDSVSGGTAKDRVRHTYNGLGQLVGQQQMHNGASGPSVNYGYSEMADGANHSQLVSMSYPNGRAVHYKYEAGLDDIASRVTYMSDAGSYATSVLERFSYLGLDTVVQRLHPLNGLDLTYVGTPDMSGDIYGGLDRFGRVIDQRWVQGPGGVGQDRFKYGYDANGNRLYKENVLAADHPSCTTPTTWPRTTPTTS
jgi:hypothetical protein